MYRFYASYYFDLAILIQQISSLLTLKKNQSKEDYSETISLAIGMLKNAIRGLELIGLEFSIKKARALVAACGSASFNQDKIANQLKELLERITDELEEGYFLHLNDNEAELYISDNPLLGIEVQNKFPNMMYDIDESSKCAGLGRYTASVFHLMRVMEFGVQKFGEKLGVTLIDQANGKPKLWQNILNESDKAIKALQQHDQLTKRLACISSNLYNVKLAWRNEVMHPKATYTEEEAKNIIFAVKAFMNELASVI